MEWTIPLTEPDLSQEEIDAVTEVLKSRWLTMGAATVEFERQFAAKVGVKYAFAVNNCTAALHLANLILDIGPGDEVICPNLTFVASANATRYTGASVVFADVISEHDLTVDPRDIEGKITERTKAITVVHYAGFPCDMEAIMAIARKHGVKVIEDCAHAPFAWYQPDGGPKANVGTIGDVGCFSFFGNKNMTTGEGGMIVTNDDHLAEKIRLLRSHGMTTLSYERHKGHASGYDVVTLGYNYRSDELHSAIGLCQLAKIDRLNEARRQVFRWYIEELGNHPNITVPFARRNVEQSACHIMSVVIHENYQEIKDRLRSKGIQTSRHYELVTRFSIYQDAVGRDSKVDDGKLMTLPLGPTMTRSSVQTIAGLLKRP